MRIFTEKSSYGKGDKRVAATGVKGREEMRSSQGGGDAEGAAAAGVKGAEAAAGEQEKTDQEQE